MEFFWENSERVSAVNFLRIKRHPRCLTGLMHFEKLRRTYHHPTLYLLSLVYIKKRFLNSLFSAYCLCDYRAFKIGLMDENSILCRQFFFTCNIIVYQSIFIKAPLSGHNWKSFKMVKKVFLFYIKISFRFRYIYIIVLTWLGYVEEWLDKKTKVNFKIYDFTDWTTNNYNTGIAQYLKK